jgi:hypothetical protein
MVFLFLADVLIQGAACISIDLMAFFSLKLRCFDDLSLSLKCDDDLSICINRNQLAIISQFLEHLYWCYHRPSLLSLI